MIRSGIIYLVTELLAKSLPFLLLPLLTAYLTPSEYGFVANFNIALMLVTCLVQVGSQGYLKSEYFVRPELCSIHVSTALLLSFIVVICLCAILALASLTGFASGWLLLLLLAIVGGGLSVPIELGKTLLVCQQRPILFGIINITFGLANVGWSLFFVVVMGLAGVGRIYAIVLSFAITAALASFLLWRCLALRFDFAKSSGRGILAFGAPLLVHHLSVWVRSGADRPLMTAFSGLGALGLFSVAFQVASVLNVAYNAINNVVSVKAFELLSREGDSRSGVGSLLLKSSLIVLVMGGGFAAIIPFIWKFFVDDRYSDAMVPTFVLLIGFLFQGLYLVVSSVLFYFKETSLISKVSACSAALHVVFAIPLIFHYGYFGAAASWVFSSVVQFLLAWSASHIVLRRNRRAW